MSVLCMIFTSSRLKKLSWILLLAPNLASSDEVPMKTGVVNMTQLAQEFYKTKDLQKVIEKEKEAVVAELTERQKAIGELKSKLTELKTDINQPSNDDKRRKKLTEEYQQTFQQFNSAEAELNELLGRRQRAFQEKYRVDLVNLAKEIHVVVQQHAKEEAFDFVFDKTAGSANGGIPVIQFSKDAVDITSVILEKINKNQPAQADAPTPDVGNP